jgi:large subunit ribosomal protein L33
LVRKRSRVRSPWWALFRAKTITWRRSRRCRNENHRPPSVRPEQVLHPKPVARANQPARASPQRTNQRRAGPRRRVRARLALKLPRATTFGRNVRKAISQRSVQQGRVGQKLPVPMGATTPRPPPRSVSQSAEPSTAAKAVPAINIGSKSSGMRRSRVTRLNIRMECKVCGSSNYRTTRNPAQEGQIVLKKYCPPCNAHTPHHEAK